MLNPHHKSPVTRCCSGWVIQTCYEVKEFYLILLDRATLAVHNRLVSRCEWGSLGPDLVHQGTTQMYAAEVEIMVESDSVASSERRMMKNGHYLSTHKNLLTDYVLLYFSKIKGQQIHKKYQWSRPKDCQAR